MIGCIKLEKLEKCFCMENRTKREGLLIFHSNQAGKATQREQSSKQSACNRFLGIVVRRQMAQ
jgi:hypothetical protein